MNSEQISKEFEKLYALIKDQNRVIDDLRQEVRELKAELGKIKVRDLLKSFQALFTYRFASLVEKYYAFEVERNPGLWQESSVNLSAHVKAVIVSVKRAVETDQIKEIVEQKRAFDERCGYDCLKVAEYCYNHLKTEESFNAMAHPLIACLSDPVRLKHLKPEAAAIINLLTPNSKQFASVSVTAILKEEFVNKDICPPKGKSTPRVLRLKSQLAGQVWHDSNQTSTPKQKRLLTRQTPYSKNTSPMQESPSLKKLKRNK
ncbi:hypothetical protein MP228_002985 [Amoeboaphelidium protococcarum]|nr:hypothetical protein MP228_002985 [Amoeboaphelidium protococcarum]